jgi:hypothetical protein
MKPTLLNIAQAFAPNMDSLVKKIIMYSGKPDSDKAIKSAESLKQVCELFIKAVTENK